MNADPDEGQPTTVPESTAAETAPPEAPETPEAEAESEAGSGTDAVTAEAETGEAEPEAEDTDPAGDAAEAEDSEPEASATDEPAGEPEPEPQVAATAEPEPGPEPEPEAEPKPKPAAKPAPEPAPTTPLVANRYRLVSEIGGGAMGVVWRARDEVLGRDVAVKELRPDHGMSGAQVRISHQRARREGRIAARLQHPNAVVIYDVAEHDGRPYLIMEYVPSQSLADILATGAVLTPAEVTSIGAQLASALTAAHERGIVHRDIKPGNVLMTSDGTVKLTDFGISRAAGDATVTATGEILGTPAYTAPEVAQGHPVAFPADVFSLGATLYAAVEGIPPFGEDANAMATLLRVVRNEIRPPKRSGPLTETIMWMLNPEPLNRPTMKQVWQGLDAQSAKPLPAVGIKPRSPETKAFDAPSPTLVVADPVLNTPKARPEPATTPPPPQPAKAQTPTPAAAAGPVSPVASSTTSSTTSSTPGPASTPTSAMVAGPTRNTGLAARPATTPPASTPPPDSKRPIPASASAPPPASRSRSRMPLAVAVCVIGTTVLIVAIVVAMNAGGHSSSGQPVAHGSTTSAPSSPARSTSPSNQPSTSSAGSVSTSAPSSSSASSPSTSPTDTAAQISSFLTNYYSLLPGNQDQAWGSLTTDYQTNTAKGRSGYQSWWDSISRVELKNVVANPPSSVTATIDYYFKNGSRTAERTSFGLVHEGGVWKIASSSVLSSEPF